MKKYRRTDAGRRAAVLGLLSALALCAFLLESLVPIPYLPGAKLGLANIFSMLALLLYGLPDALLVVLVRTFLGSLFAGNVSMLLYSMTAGIAAALITRPLLFALPHLSFPAISIVGAVVHNMVQLAVYCGLTGTALLFGYAPYLCLMGIFSGTAVGLAVMWTLKALPANFFAADKKHMEVSD